MLEHRDMFPFLFPFPSWVSYAYALILLALPRVSRSLSLSLVLQSLMHSDAFASPCVLIENGFVAKPFPLLALYRETYPPRWIPHITVRSNHNAFKVITVQSTISPSTGRVLRKRTGCR